MPIGEQAAAAAGLCHRAAAALPSPGVLGSRLGAVRKDWGVTLLPGRGAGGQGRGGCACPPPNYRCSTGLTPDATEKGETSDIQVRLCTGVSNRRSPPSGCRWLKGRSQHIRALQKEDPPRSFAHMVFVKKPFCRKRGADQANPPSPFVDLAGQGSHVGLPVDHDGQPSGLVRVQKAQTEVLVQLLAALDLGIGHFAHL